MKTIWHHFYKLVIKKCRIILYKDGWQGPRGRPYSWMQSLGVAHSVTTLHIMLFITIQVQRSVNRGTRRCAWPSPRRSARRWRCRCARRWPGGSVTWCPRRLARRWSRRRARRPGAGPTRGWCASRGRESSAGPRWVRILYRGGSRYHVTNYSE